MVDEYFLRQASIFELRNIARDMGVISPTIYKKEELIDRVLKIENGEEKPQMPKSRQGRPPKSVFNQNTSQTIMQSNDKYISFKDIIQKSEPVIEKQYLEKAKSFNGILSSDGLNYGVDYEITSKNEKTQTGYYGIVDDEFGFVFDCNSTDIEDVIFVPYNLIQNYALRTGDIVEYRWRYVRNSNAKYVCEIISINKRNIYLQDRVNFNKLEIDLTSPKENLGLSEVNSKVPDVNSIKCGTRNLICVKDITKIIETILKLQSLSDNYHIINLRVDIMPEEIASLRNENNIENFYTTIGESNRQSSQIIALAIERAKRLAEYGEKVIFVASEAKKIVKQKNFSLNYCAEDIKYRTFDTCYQILGLSRRLKTGANITTFLFLKQDDEPSEFEKSIKNDLSSLPCDVYNLY